MSQFHEQPTSWICECGSVPYFVRVATGLRGALLYSVACLSTNCVHYGKVTMYQPPKSGTGVAGAVKAEFRLIEPGGGYSFTGFKKEPGAGGSYVKYTAEEVKDEQKS